MVTKKKTKNEPERRDPCEELPDGKCKCKHRWCKDKDEGSCGYCLRHCICKKRIPFADRPKPDKTGCEKAANGKALCNFEWCKHHPKLCSRCCKTCNEPKKVIATVSCARPQRERQVVVYIDPDSDVEEEDAEERTTSQQQRVQSLGDLCLAFPTTISMKNMPSELLRNKQNAGTVIQDLNMRSSPMVDLLCEVMQKSAEIILPGDAIFLLSRAMETLEAKNLKQKAEVEGKLKRKAGVADKLVATMSSLIVGLPKGTFGYRVTRALAVQSFSPRDLKLHFPEHQQILTFGSHGRSKARKHFDQMNSNKVDILHTKRTVSRVSDERIQKAVSHILSPQMVNTLAWGTKEVTIPGTTETVTLPKVTRKMTKEDMYRNFKFNQRSDAIFQDRVVTRSRNAEASMQMMGRTSYLSIVDAITHDEEKLSQSICYVTDLLINEQIATLQRIVNDLVAPVNKKEITHLLGLLQNFLKYQYEGHVKRDDAVSCCEARISSSFLLLLTHCYF
jgi:hypothetical protein